MACQRASAGLGSTLPAGSTARAASVCQPGVSPVRVRVGTHAAYGPPSTLHWYVAAPSEPSANTALLPDVETVERVVSGAVLSVGVPLGDGVDADALGVGTDGVCARTSSRARTGLDRRGPGEGASSGVPVVDGGVGAGDDGADAAGVLAVPAPGRPPGAAGRGARGVRRAGRAVGPGCAGGVLVGGRVDDEGRPGAADAEGGEAQGDARPPEQVEQGTS